MLAALPLLVLQVMPLAVAPHASFSRLPSGNGFGTAVYDAAAGRIVNLREHGYQSVDSGAATRDLIFDTYFGLRAAGQSGWLTPDRGVPVESAALEGGVITTVQHRGGLTATMRWFSPLGVAAPSLLGVLTVKNEGAQPIDDVHLFSLHNLHLGDGDGTQGQRLDWDAAHASFVQRSLSSQRVAIARALPPPAHHACTPQNPYGLVNANQLFPDVATSGDGGDMASGFQWDVGTLAPGVSSTAAILIAYHPFGDTAALQAMADVFAGAQPPEALAARELQAWRDWTARARVPAGLTVDEEALYRQQLAILRMAQVREPNDVAKGYLPFGQITASVRPGKWDIAWVRDGCLAIAALARAGYLDEARAGLEFMLQATAGLYQQYVGRPYRISVVRYFGKGKEESDFDQNGPNVEYDGFGMFLWSLGEYLGAGGDAAILDGWWTAIADGTADVLAQLVEQTSGLLQADSSIWESHWDNGGRQHYAWSNAWAAAGLERAASWADARSDGRAAKWRSAAQAIRGAMASRLTAGGVLRPSVERSATVDAAAVEAFNLGVLDPQGPLAHATIDAILAKLTVASGHGLKRNQNGGSYDEHEWVVMDLRMSQALRRAGRASDGDALWSWVRDQALANHGLLPELYDPVTADYAGEVPMAGFGAGAYVLTAWDRAAPVGSDGGAIVDGGAVDGGPGGGGGGCGCAVGGRQGGGAIATGLLLALGALTRRRSVR